MNSGKGPWWRNKSKSVGLGIKDLCVPKQMQICKQCEPLSMAVLNEFRLCFALFFNKANFSILGEFIIFIDETRLSYGVHEIELDTQGTEYFWWDKMRNFSYWINKSKPFNYNSLCSKLCEDINKHSVTSIVRQVVSMMHFVAKG